MRIAKMCRGIAEPMCAAYTAAYLARVGQSFFPTQKDYLVCLIDFLFKLYDITVKRGHQQLDLETYLSLFEPPIDWLIQCLAYEADRSIFATVWDLYGKHNKHVVFLKSIVKYFPSLIIAAATTTLMKSIKEDYVNKVDD